MSNPNFYVIPSPTVSGSFVEQFPEQSGLGRVWWQNDTAYGHTVTLDSPTGPGYYVPAYHARLWTQRSPVHTFYYAVGGVTQLATAANSPITYAQVDFYGLTDLPGVPDGLFALGNRMSSVGNTPGVSVIATQLGTTTDGVVCSQGFVPGSSSGEDQIVPTFNNAPAGSTRDLGLFVLLNQGGVTVSAEVMRLFGAALGLYGVQDARLNGNLGVSGKFLTLGGALGGAQQTTAGNYGVAVVAALQEAVLVTVLTQQTVVSFAVSVDGTYRVSATCKINNGTSGNAVLFGVQYTSAFPGNAVVTASLTGNGVTGAGAADVAMNGNASIVNGDYAMNTKTLKAKGGTTIFVIYRDPTNTPSDTVDAWIERLS